jgi:TIR domain
MATLREYFAKDGAQNLTTHEMWEVKNQETGEKYGEIVARLHFDFEAHAKYVSFFIPDMAGVELAEAIALNDVSKILKSPEEHVGVQMGLSDERKDGKNLIFTGQIYLYSERPVPEAHKARLIAEAQKVGHKLTFRSVEYMNERNKWEKPLAFISHDSRDKAEIAQPLAIKLLQFMCPVWYDEFSLKVGDSLRGSIEAGLKECPKCIFLLTPNFLANSGWSKTEYDSIFTRELVEKQRVVLPVWHNVTAKDVYEYSPVLANRVAVNWSLGVDEVARRLLMSINAPQGS